MMRIRGLVVLAVFGALLLAACGGDAAGEATPTTVAGEMSDDEMSDDEMSDDEMSDDEMSDDEMSDDEMSEMNDLISVIQGRDDLSTFDELVHAAEMQDMLHTGGPFTVFAPTNAAFEAYFGEMGMVADDLSQEQALALLQAHLVEGVDDADMVMGMADQSFTTLDGGSFDVTVDGETVMVGGATVVEYDLTADNGVVHVIDTVLEPAG